MGECGAPGRPRGAGLPVGLPPRRLEEGRGRGAPLPAGRRGGRGEPWGARARSLPRCGEGPLKVGGGRRCRNRGGGGPNSAPMLGPASAAPLSLALQAGWGGQPLCPFPASAAAPQPLGRGAARRGPNSGSKMDRGERGHPRPLGRSASTEAEMWRAGVRRDLGPAALRGSPRKSGAPQGH